MSKAIDIVILLAMIVLSGWVSAQFGQITGRQHEANVANIYNSMAILALIVALGAAVRFGFLEFEGLNKEPKEFIMFLLVGGVIGFLLTSSGKMAFTQLLGAGAIDPALSFAFVIILAVFVETYLFVGALFPSIEKFLAGRTNSMFATIMAAVVVSLLFAGFHIVATNGDISRMSGEFIFCIIMIAAQKVMGSIAGPLGVHFSRNLITAG